MKPFLSLTFHGVLDYLTSAVLIASPWLFHFSNAHGAALFIPLYLGSLTLILTYFSRTPLGVIRQIPMELHLSLDVLVGFFILVSPFLYGFYNVVCLPHVILGLILFLSGIFTEKSPFTSEYKVIHRGYGFGGYNYEGEDAF